MRILILIFFIALFCSSVKAQDTIIARIGNKVITSTELKTRFEFSPQVYGKVDIEKKKELFLYTLIAEKLFALEAEKNSADTAELIKYTYGEIERMFLRDALYKIEISDHVIISEDELKNAATREMYKLVLTPYFIPDSLQARSLYKNLLNGANSDTTYSAPDIEVGYGELRSDIENAVYNLKKGESTIPIQYGKGWYIFRLKEKKIADPDKDLNTVIKNAETKLKDMKSEYIYHEYFNHFFSGRSVDANGDIFWSIVNKLAVIYKNKTPGKEGYSLQMDDVHSLEHQFGDSLWTVYIKIDNSPLNIKSFLRKLYFQGFSTEMNDEGTIAAKLNAAVKLIIENELLTAEAYKKGLQHLPEVQMSLKMWKDNNLSTVHTMFIADSISSVPDQDDFRTDLISIIEVKTANLSDIEKMLDELADGNEFEEIVKLYNKQNGFPEDKGFFNLVPASSLGETGKIALNLKEGDVYGPVAMQEKYSVIKLLKKQKSAGGVKGDKEKSAAYSEYARNLDAVKNSAVKLASKYGVKINFDALQKISASDHNMFTIRMMGFGGRIPAVPVVSPFYEWYDLWQKSTKEVP